MKTLLLLLAMTASAGIFKKGSGRGAEAPPTPATAPGTIAVHVGGDPAGATDPNGWPAPVWLAPPDAQRSDSGLAWVVVASGDGEGVAPTADAAVTVHYQGFMVENGELFDSSYGRGQPATFPLSGVVRGWTEGLQYMRPGDRYRFWIPGRLAYGDEPGAAGRPYGTLLFDIELIQVNEGANRAVPRDLQPPIIADHSPTGLAWMVLESGDGGERPGPRSVVTVNYAGWTQDGREFDSSWRRGTSVSMPLDRVIPGWTEGVQQMHRGDVVRFWVPPALAYENNPRAPQGMLTFDIELIDFEP